MPPMCLFRYCRGNTLRNFIEALDDLNIGYFMQDTDCDGYPLCMEDHDTNPMYDHYKAVILDSGDSQVKVIFLNGKLDGCTSWRYMDACIYYIDIKHSIEGTNVWLTIPDRDSPQTIEGIIGSPSKRQLQTCIDILVDNLKDTEEDLHECTKYANSEQLTLRRVYTILDTLSYNNIDSVHSGVMHAMDTLLDNINECPCSTPTQEYMDEDAYFGTPKVV